MKNTRLFSLLFAAGSLVGCNNNALLEPEFPEYLLIDGDTVRIREDIGKRYLSPHDFSTIIVGDTLVVPNYKKRIKQPLSKPNEELLKKGIEDPDLIGKPLRVIATGFFSRNGTAINNEEIEYSISNIIVNQMGVEFKNPYFDKDDFNGVFTYVPTNFNPTGGPLPKFKAAKNNLAIDYFEKDGSPVLRKLHQDRVDNLLLFMDEKTWLERLNSKLNYEQTVLHEKFDFMINISPNDDMMSKGLEGYEPWKPLKSPWDQSYRSSKLDMFSEVIKRENVKGILINSRITIPGLMLELIPVEDVRRELEKYQKGRLLDKDAVVIYPTSKIDSLLGPNVNMNLKPYISSNEKILDYSSTDPQKRVEVYDSPKRSKLAEQLNWPELDINYIHTQIYLGKYISPDGVRVNYKDIHDEGFLNFSKLRNIILANEALKAINEYYGTSFSYINTRGYLRATSL